MENPKQTVETYAPIFMPLLETPKGEVALVELAVKFVE
jgi:ABC-type cobalt transport system substrate-binding protein